LRIRRCGGQGKEEGVLIAASQGEGGMENQDERAAWDTPFFFLSPKFLLANSSFPQISLDLFFKDFFLRNVSAA
jgi:hypothetical protein